MTTTTTRRRSAVANNDCDNTTEERKEEEIPKTADGDHHIEKKIKNKDNPNDDNVDNDHGDGEQSSSQLPSNDAAAIAPDASASEVEDSKYKSCDEEIVADDEAAVASKMVTSTEDDHDNELIENENDSGSTDNDNFDKTIMMDREEQNQQPQQQHGTVIEGLEERRLESIGNNNNVSATTANRGGGDMKHHGTNIYADVNKKSSRITSVQDYTMLEEGYKPNEEDVICSWARQNHSHPGNVKFRHTIAEYAPTYLNVNTKYQKSDVIAKIVAEVRNRSPGGGFVKKDFYSNRWFEVGDEKARDKVGHAIRKAALELIKKLRGGGKLQPQSLQKRRAMKNNSNHNSSTSSNHKNKIVDTAASVNNQYQQLQNQQLQLQQLQQQQDMLDGVGINNMQQQMMLNQAARGLMNGGGGGGMMQMEMQMQQFRHLMGGGNVGGGIQMPNDMNYAAAAASSMNNMNAFMNPMNNLGNIGGGSRSTNTAALMGGMNGMNAANVMGGMNGMNGRTNHNMNLEEMVMMNRLPADLVNNCGNGNGGYDSSFFGGLSSPNNNAAPSSTSGNVGSSTVGGGGSGGFNMEESAMVESLQRRNMLLNAAHKEQQAINRLCESKELPQMARNPMNGMLDGSNNTSKSNASNNGRSAMIADDNLPFGEFAPNVRNPVMDAVNARQNILSKLALNGSIGGGVPSMISNSNNSINSTNNIAASSD